jgi:hypothetical protein
MSVEESFNKDDQKDNPLSRYDIPCNNGVYRFQQTTLYGYIVFATHISSSQPVMIKVSSKALALAKVTRQGQQCYEDLRQEVRFI